jgi:NADH-quinone oxidoreductase subunit A
LLKVSRSVSELLNNWVAVIVGSLAGVILVATALIGNFLFAPRSPSRAKATAYECGMLPIGRSIGQVHVRYYLFAILFLLFDVEAVFLFPWAVTFLGLGQAAFYEMVLFILILGAGLAYAWRRGVLQWR